MTMMMKRLTALVLALCLLLGCAAFAEETPDIVFEEATVEEDAEDAEAADEEEDEDSFYIDEETSEVLEDLDTERDLTIDPNSLELNPNLPDHIVNILLIGVDTRDKDLNAGMQHGDVQIICSINTKTGSIKLTSILRDTKMVIPGYKSENRINVTYARGGGQLNMRTINHNFELNIQYYVAVNFFGLASIIDSLGGVDIQMSKAEAKAINTYIRKHPPRYDNRTDKRTPLEAKAGVHHCDGIQAVMYARLRSLDSDFKRTERQRNLMEILLRTVTKNLDIPTLTSLMTTCLNPNYTKTNMPADAIFSLAVGVLQTGLVERALNGDTLLEQHRIPMDKTYSYVTVNKASMIGMSKSQLKKNKVALHEFIYGEYIPAK